jgi:large subunit ribosomal protein L13
MKTYSARPQDVTRDWYVVDANDKVLGRLASAIAHRLRGKHKPIYTPHIDTGDFIVVTNVDKIKVTGNKMDDKLYHRHSGYPGGIKTENLETLLARNPERVVKLAVKRMLPKGPLGRQMLKKLKIHAGPTHPHAAQQPKARPLPARSLARTSN